MKTFDDVPEDIFFEDIFFEDAFREDTLCKKRTFAQTSEGPEGIGARNKRANVLTSEDKHLDPSVRVVRPPHLLLLLLFSCLLPLAAAPCPTPCSCLWRRY